MATRSTIAVQHADGTVSQTYCHWDGYPSHNGKLLLENYVTLEKIEQLVSFGDMSSLAEKCIPDPAFPHDFDHKQEYVTVYYGRDRGETGTQPKVFKDFEDYKKNFVGEEYDYIFTDGMWLVSAYGRPYVTIEDALKKEEDEEDED